MSLIKLREVLPLFSMAVRRSLDELEARVQAVIKEKCTAIHPSVEWRFRRAVLDSIEEHDGEEATELEPIVFRDVHPLYAATDIRGSSVERNLAVQADLGVHLRLALAVVEAARAARPLPILDEIGYRIERHARQIEQMLSSGDEVTVLAFLRQHVEPLFEQLADFGPAVRESVEAYRAALDPGLGTVYRQRRDYEESMTLVDRHDLRVPRRRRRSWPSRCSRTTSSGSGPTAWTTRSTSAGSLVEDGQFDEMYLRNLRLWQLMVTCGIARRTEADPAPADGAARHDPPGPGPSRAAVDPLPLRRAALRRRRRLQRPLRGHQEAGSTRRWCRGPGSGSRSRASWRSSTRSPPRRPSTGPTSSTWAPGATSTGEIEDLGLEELQGVQGLRALRVAIDVSTPAPEVGEAAREAAETRLRR